MALLVPNVPMPASEDKVLEAVAAMLGVRVTAIHATHLIRKSLDARHGKQNWRAVYRVEVDNEAALVGVAPGVRLWTEKDEVRYGVSDGAAPAKVVWPEGARVIVIGAGPAGLFASLFLAEAGASVVLLERGGATAERVEAVNGFWRRMRELDPENNLVFGEGGAGTFSDAKIYTRRRDGEIGYVLRRFVDFGARSDILEEGWAHLGTDKVRGILPVFRARLMELGVDVRYNARVDDLIVEDGRVRGVVMADGSVERATHVLAAPGHSARDTLTMLVKRGADAVARPIAIGARIEHPQSVIDAARYGAAKRGELPPASYRLAYNPPVGATARTFCMCPGGMVVPAINHPGHVVVNGMSFAAQRAYWANAAIIVEVQPEQYGGTGPLAGYAWQDEIERRAFDAGGGDYSAPAQRVVDLFAKRPSKDAPKTSYPLGVKATDLTSVLPGDILASMSGAIREFNRKLPGYICDDALLIAPETRTTSPIRFLRTEGGESTSIRGLYPAGEGCGFGGGIVSCAIDGIRIAQHILDPSGRAAPADLPTHE